MPESPLTRRAAAPLLLAALATVATACSARGSRPAPGPDPADGAGRGHAGQDRAGAEGPAPRGDADRTPVTERDPVLVTLRVTGGYAGVDTYTEVRRDGAYHVTRRGLAGESGQLGAAETGRLDTLLRSARLADLPARSLDPHLRDVFHYRVSHGGHTVVTDLSDTVEPLKLAVELIPH